MSDRFSNRSIENILFQSCISYSNYHFVGFCIKLNTTSAWKCIEFSSIAIPDHILQKFYIIHIQQITKTHVYKHLWESTKITMAWSKNVQGHSLTRTYHLCIYTATQLPIHSKKNRWVLNYRLSSCKSVLGLVFTFQRIISSFFFTL